MYRSNPPTFPKFEWDGFFWSTSAKLSAWAGYQIRNGPYGSVSAPGPSDGTLLFRIAPEGQNDDPLSDREIGLVHWVIKNQKAVHDAMLQKLCDEYPSMREQASYWLDDDEMRQIFTDIRFKSQLRTYVGFVAIHVHHIEQDGIPFFGVELGCTWDDEHGVGILLHGAKPLEIGGADTAFTLGIAEKYLRKPS